MATDFVDVVDVLRLLTCCIQMRANIYKQHHIYSCGFLLQITLLVCYDVGQRYQLLNVNRCRTEDILQANDTKNAKCQIMQQHGAG